MQGGRRKSSKIHNRIALDIGVWFVTRTTWDKNGNTPNEGLPEKNDPSNLGRIKEAVVERESFDLVATLASDLVGSM